ncbi:hypothetical protein L1049_028039 [Liquidambar formosana]|uniref:Uncharacterized protein n=1 Tax=Liquidambar formosana TaxID=63359 RepID=A0AAP0RJS5_LIQFO
MISSKQSLEKQIMNVEKRLIFRPYSVNVLLNLFNRLAFNLSKVGPFLSRSMQDAHWPSMNALITPKLLRHPNVNVRISVASCLCEIVMITVSSPPSSDEKMQKVFQIIVATFGTLFPEYKYYYTSFAILHNVARTKLCLTMLNLGCDELLIEMFQYFLAVAQFHCPDGMFANIEEIMTMVLEESNDISKELLYPLLDSIREEDENVGSLSWQLGEQVLTNCVDKLKPYLMEAVQSLDFVLDDYAPIVASICEESYGVVKEQVVGQLFDYYQNHFIIKFDDR